MAKINVRIQGTDKVTIDFRSDGSQDLREGDGKPVVSSGNPKDRTAVVHGTVPGTTINFQSPA